MFDNLFGRYLNIILTLSDKKAIRKMSGLIDLTSIEQESNKADLPSVLLVQQGTGGIDSKQYPSAYGVYVQKGDRYYESIGGSGNTRGTISWQEDSNQWSIVMMLKQNGRKVKKHVATWEGEGVPFDTSAPFWAQWQNWQSDPERVVIDIDVKPLAGKFKHLFVPYKPF